MKKSNEYLIGYKQGRLDEAKITLGNLYRVLDEMIEQPHPSNHITTCISDLEKALNMNRKDFEDEEDCFHNG